MGSLAKSIAKTPKKMFDLLNICSLQKTEIGAAGQSRMWADSLKKTAHAKTRKSHVSRFSTLLLDSACWPFSHRAQSKMSAAAFSLSARAAVATRVTAPVQQRRGAFLPSRLTPRALPGPTREKSRRPSRPCFGFRVCFARFGARPGRPGEPRTPTNASPRATHAARGPPASARSRETRGRTLRRDAASPSRKRHYWITWCFSTFRRVFFFRARARL